MLGLPVGRQVRKRLLLGSIHAHGALPTLHGICRPAYFSLREAPGDLRFSECYCLGWHDVEGDGGADFEGKDRAREKRRFA